MAELRMHVSYTLPLFFTFLVVRRIGAIWIQTIKRDRELEESLNLTSSTGYRGKADYEADEV